MNRWPEGWRLREVEAADLPAMHALRLRALRDHPDAFGASVEGYPDAEAYARRHLERVANGTVCLAVFDADGAPLGTASLVPRSGPKERHRGDIFAVYTAPEARGRGVATALLEALTVKARTLGLRRIGIAATAHNPSLAVYERLGFRRWGREPEALRVGDRYLDEVWLSLRLDDDPEG